MTSGEATNENASHQNEAIGADNPEDLLLMLWDAIKKFYCQAMSVFNIIMEMGWQRIFNKVAQWCALNPYLAICVFAAAAVMFLPFMIIVGFSFATIIMTFTGFLVLEGTLFTILSILLFGCLGALVVLASFFGIFGVAVYFGFIHIYDLYGGFARHKEAIMKFLQVELESKRDKTSPANTEHAKH